MTPQTNMFKFLDLAQLQQIYGRHKQAKHNDLEDDTSIFGYIHLW